jgi:hypothetical protein
MHYPKKKKKKKFKRLATPKPVASTKQMRTFSLPSSHLSFQKSTQEVMDMGALRIKSSNLLKSSKLHHTYYYITLLNIATVVQVCWVLIKNKQPHHQA